jgi:hypothetical protein
MGLLVIIAEPAINSFQSPLEAIVSIFTAIRNVYDLYFSLVHYQQVFFKYLGYNKNQSEFLATVFVTVNWGTLLAVSGFVFLVSRGMLSAKKVAVGLLGFCGLFAIPPAAKLIYSALPRNACFDQVDGQPIKWFVVRSSRYVLFDDPGYDPYDGTLKQPVTSDICRAFDQQQAGIVPRPLGNAEAIDTLPTGIWYYRRDNVLYLFSAQIPIPGTRELTKPVTSEIVAEIRAGADGDKRRAEEEQLRQQATQRAEAELARKNQLRPLQNALTTVPNRYKCLLKNDGLVLDASLKESIAFEKLSVFVDNVELESDAGNEKVNARAIEIQGPDYLSNPRQYCVALAIPNFNASDSVGVAQIQSVLDAFRALNSKVSYQPETTASIPSNQMYYAPSSGTNSAPGAVEQFLDSLLPAPINSGGWQSNQRRNPGSRYVTPGHINQSGRR